MNRLPPEILATCATFVFETDPRPIVSLTHVCRYWRRSVSFNPRCWASIAIGWMRLAPLCLQRAGAVPLAVHITVPGIEGDPGFLKTLLPHVARVAHLSLRGYTSNETMANDLPSLFTSPMLDLTRLDFQQAGEPAELFPSSEAPVPPGVPKGIKTQVTQLGPYARLRHLSITCARPTDARGVLSHMSLPRGIHLEVVYQGPGLPDLDKFLPFLAQPVQKSSSQIIAIRFRYSPRDLRVFGTNDCFSFRSPNSPTQDLEFYLFATTSVREFHMNVAPCALTPALLAQPLSQLPALEILVFTSVTRWVTGAFNSLAGQPLLCPSLKTIAFFDRILTPEVVGELRGVVVKRKGLAAAWLYRVVIFSSTGVLPNYALIQ